MTAAEAAPRRPAFRPPPGACDAHVHIWGPYARFPLSPRAPYRPPERTAADLAALHERLGIDRAVIVQTTVYGADNRAMLEAIAGSGGRWRGVALVDENTTEADLRALHEGGVRGVRFGFLRHLGGVPDLSLLRRTAERIGPMGWHLVLHMDAPALLAFEDLLWSLPCPAVIDHMGRVPAEQGLDQPAFRLLLRLVKEGGFWVKISGADRISAAGPPFRDAIPFARALIEAAPERVIWGSDWPHPNVRWHPDEADLLDLLPACADAATLRRVLVDNPARLYGFA
ncbi:MAG: amidohydrolase family protein [Rhodovarius sp.]|nr:amidohydrolase family protein [Rhodovarius sp.]